MPKLSPLHWSTNPGRVSVPEAQEVQLPTRTPEAQSTEVGESFPCALDLKFLPPRQKLGHAPICSEIREGRVDQGQIGRTPRGIGHDLQ